MLRAKLSNRFYDNEQEVSTALEIISMFPGYIQDIVSRGLTLISVQDFKLEAKLRNIGFENVLALYKSKLKRRKADHSVCHHDAVNHLRLLDLRERHVVASRIIEMAGCIDFYLTECEMVEIQKQQNDVTDIRDTYIKLGPEIATEFVNRLRFDIINARRNSGKETGFIVDDGKVQEQVE